MMSCMGDGEKDSAITLLSTLPACRLSLSRSLPGVRGTSTPAASVDPHG